MLRFCGYILAIVFIATCLTTACTTKEQSPPLANSTPTNTSGDERASALKKAAASHAEARRLFEDGHYVEAVDPAQLALDIREKVLGPEHLELATSLTTLGEIHSTLIELGKAKPLLERGLEIRRGILGPRHPEVAESLTHLGALSYAAGNFRGSIQILNRALTIREEALGSSHPDVAVTLTHLAIAERGLSQLDRAKANAERAIGILRTASAERRKDLAIAVNVDGNILGRLGHFEQSRNMLEESLHLFEQASGSQHPHVAGALVQLAMLEGKQGNHRAALSLLEQALTINEASYGKNNPEVAGTLYEVGLAERALGMTDSAQRRFEQSLRIQEATVGANHPFVALTLIELAEGQKLRGDSATAHALLRRALDVQENSLGREHTSVAITLMKLGYLEVQAGNLSTAEDHFERAARIREQALGPNHPDVAASLLDVARAQHARGSLSHARSVYERARLIIQAQAGKNPGLDDETLARLWKRDVKGLQDYALLLAMLARSSKGGREQQSAIADGFAVTQQARGWLMQAAVAKALAQQQSGNQTEVTLAKQIDDLRRRRQGLWNRLDALYGISEDQRDAADLATTKGRLSEIQQELERTNVQLQSVAPRYAESTQPQAIDIATAQRLLRPGEALISFYTLPDRVQIWAIRKEKTILYREAPIDRAKLLKLVQQLRLSLLPRVDPSTNESFSVAYDVESASDLYKLLFEPLHSALTDVHQLLLIPDDALLPLPFAALVTQREGDAFARLAQIYRRKQTPTSADLADYAGLPWLAKSYPISVLPSASALKLLRQYTIVRADQSEPFLGFGDPALRGKGNQRGGKMVATRGMRVAVDSLRELDSLPGTRQELLAVANVLHVSPETSLFLGSRATETEVRRLNDIGRLGSAKVVSFATHGLLAGEIQGLSQPALVLTPPDRPTDDNDGLLSMEDILQLKLPNSDWVILSACNTAGDDGSGESLSGLARAFFFAGAKSLLVSQWSVDDEATRELMAAIFARYGGDDSVSQAKALGDGILSLLDQAQKDPEKRYFAHPYAWAAFFLVGDGASKG